MTNPNAQVGQGPQPGSGGGFVAADPSDDASQIEGVDSTYLTEIGGKTPPPMQTLVHQPDVRIWIAHGNKQYDVSADVVAVSVARQENAISTAAFRLANKRDDGKREGPGRYTPLFAPMDRVVIQMKRLEWVQVFSGFLDRTPVAQLYPGTVDFRASCTLKKLLHTWWDPGLPRSAEILNQQANDANERNGMEMQQDAGLGSTLRRLLVQVGNWDAQHVHIQRFPMGYFNFMKMQVAQYKGTDQAVQTFRRMLLGDDVSGGVGAAAGRQVGVTKGGYVTGSVDRKLEVLRAVDEMGMGPTTKDIGLGQAITEATTGAKDKYDQPAWGAHEEIGRNYTEAALKNDAAVHCFMTIMAESNWIMYANASDPRSLEFPHEGVSTDHTSSGLYQQQTSWGTIDQRMNVRESSGMFLRELNTHDWRNMPRPAACQAVQRSAFSDGSNYAAHEQTAMEEVLGLRQGSGSGGTGQSSGANGIPGAPGLGSTAVTSAPPPITAGIPGSQGLPGIPSTNGQPSPAAATTQAGKPQFDLAKAISAGLSKLGTPYEWGAKGPDKFDCSGFTSWCYRAMGMEIGGDTYTQADKGTHISFASIQPGDLILPSDEGHVVMWLGEGSVLHAPQTGDVVKVSPLWFTPDIVITFPPAEYGGVYPVPFDPPTGAPGAEPGTVAQGSQGGTYTTGSNEPIARNLFSYQFEPGRYLSTVSGLFGGGGGSPAEAAFINDEPILQTVIALCAAGLRKFQSLPNGDFAAYYPDYFGLDGKDAVMDLEDIEMKDVTIDWNDDALATHVYVAGSAQARGVSQGTMGWLNTKGICTVETPWLFRRMTAAAPQVKGAEMRNGSEIMRRYGVRPLTQDMPAIQSGAMEFLMALQIFMTKWAEQYSTQVEFTFMPELYPGMRINLKNHNLQVYVSGVTHSGDFENGFTTTATIMAPSTNNIWRIATQLADQMQGKNWDQSDIDGRPWDEGGWMFPG